MNFGKLSELVKTSFDSSVREKCQVCVCDILSGVIRGIPDILGVNPRICPQEFQMENLAHEGVEDGHDYGKETHFLASVPFSAAIGHLLTRGWIPHDALLKVLRENGYKGACLSEILRDPAALAFCEGLYAMEDSPHSESKDYLAGRKQGPFQMPYLLTILMIVNRFKWKPILVKMNFVKNACAGRLHTDGREWEYYRCEVPTSPENTMQDVAKKIVHAMGFAEHSQNLLKACLANAR